MPALDSIQVSYATRVHAPIEAVFPLCCPVEEYKWIPGWKCDLVHCPNERVEQGTVFDEYSSAPFLMGKAWGKTTWTAVLHDPEQHRVHYELKNVASDSLYKIELSDNGSDGTLAQLDFRYSAITPLGLKVIRNRGEAKIELMLQILTELLRNYCERGGVARPGRIARVIATSDALTAADRIRLFVNGFAMARKRDSFRRRYMKELAAGLR
ncbi:MAG: hypothetical protein OES69_05360 [Myxococcales bacterium]|nr:hypothetical protein [Myxococcales bacterium]MDH3843344.1 hypothetical protein [Myxococcales bacterium]